MNLSEQDRLNFYQIACEAENYDPKRLTRQKASTTLYRAFWRREFDAADQPDDADTCLLLPYTVGGKVVFNPVTRQFVRGILGIGDPRWQPLGAGHPDWRDPSFETLARLDADDSLSVWLCGRPEARLSLHTGPDPAVPVQDLWTVAGPHRPPGCGTEGSVS